MLVSPLPDASLHNPEPGYFRRLLAQCGFTYVDAAKFLKCGERTIKRYASGESEFDYQTQFLLECVAVLRLNEQQKSAKLSGKIGQTDSNDAVLRLEKSAA